MSGQALTAQALFTFGKLPSHGDFVARGMTPSERVAWDAWMTEGLDQARQILGEGFAARHDCAPAWRFVFPPAVFCPQGCAGVLAASIDRSGRRFAIVLAARLAGRGLTRPASEVLTAELEAALYWAFQDGAPVDDLMNRAARDLPQDDEAPSDLAACRLWTGEPFSEIIAEAPTASLLARCLAGPEG